MFIREQRQQNPVADEVLALTAVVRPILLGTLYALKNEVVSEAGGYEGVRLLMLPRLYKGEMETVEYVSNTQCMKQLAGRTPAYLNGLRMQRRYAMSPDSRPQNHFCSV
jgi:hypothetical protein